MSSKQETMLPFTCILLYLCSYQLQDESRIYRALGKHLASATALEMARFSKVPSEFGGPAGHLLERTIFSQRTVLKKPRSPVLLRT